MSNARATRSKLKTPAKPQPAVGEKRQPSGNLKRKVIQQTVEDVDFTADRIAARLMLWKQLPLEELKWWAKPVGIDITNKTKQQISEELANKTPFEPVLPNKRSKKPQSGEVSTEEEEWEPVADLNDDLSVSFAPPHTTTPNQQLENELVNKVIAAIQQQSPTCPL